MRIVQALLHSRSKRAKGDLGTRTTSSSPKVEDLSKSNNRRVPASDASQPSSLLLSSASIPSSDPVSSSTPVSASTCSHLWDKALAEAQTLPQWQKFCVILERENISASVASTQVTQTIVDAGPLNPIKIGAGSLSALNRAVEILAARKAESEPKKFRRLCKSASRTISKAKDVGNAVAALNPYASLAWGLVVFIAGAINNNHDIRQSCWSSLGGLQELILRSVTWQHFYNIQRASVSQDSLFVQLDDAFTAVFTAIINYLVSVVIFHYSKSQRVQAMLKDKAENAPKQYLDEIQAAEKRLLQLRFDITTTIHADQLKSLEAKLKDSNHSLGAVEYRVEAVEVNLRQVNQRLKAEYHRRVLAWISNIKSLEAHHKTSRRPMSGTTDWLLEHEGYRSWAKPSTSGIFWLSGKMGSGKTCVTHSVVESFSLAAKQTPNTSAVYFYCDGTNSLSQEWISSVESILCSLVKQMACANGLECLPECVTELYDRQQHDAAPSADQCVSLMKDISSELNQLTVIIDALDECPKNVGVELIRHITSTLQNGPTHWKLYISSRDHSNMERIRRKYQKEGAVAHNVNIEEYNQEAIESFVQRRVEEFASLDSEYHHLYVSGSSDQTGEVTAQLKKYAQGMFRWVSLALDHLHACDTYEEMAIARTRLGALEDLFDLYDKTYNRIMSNKSREIQDAIRTTLTLLLYGFQRRSDFEIGSQHIAQACASMSKPMFKSIYSIDDLVALCPSLVVKSGDLLSFAHFSVSEYLLDRRGKEYGVMESHARLAALCMNVFEFPGNIPKDLEAYAATYWPEHLRLITPNGALHGHTTLDVKSKCQELALPHLVEPLERFLLSQPVTIGFSRWQRAALHLGRAKSVGLFTRLLTTPLSTIYARITFNMGWKDANFLPHLLDVTSSKLHIDEPQMEKMSTLDFAVSAGALSAIDWLVESKFDINERMDYARDTVLHRVACHWRQDVEIRVRPEPELRSVITNLLDNGIDLQATNKYGDNVLFRSLSISDRGVPGPRTYDNAMLKILLDLGFKIISFKRCFHPSRGLSEYISLLEQAIASGNTSFALAIAGQWLQSQYWDVIKDKCLYKACQKFRMTPIIPFLLQNGANPLARGEKRYPLEEFLQHCVVAYTEEEKTMTEETISRLTSQMIDLGYDFSLTAPSSRGSWFVPYFYNVLRYGDLKTIKTWVEHGANPTIIHKRKDRYLKYIPIHESAQCSGKYSKEVDEYFRTLPDYEISRVKHEKEKEDAKKAKEARKKRREATKAKNLDLAPNEESSQTTHVPAKNEDTPAKTTETGNVNDESSTCSAPIPA